MPNEVVDPRTKANQVRTMFGRIARRYDLMNTMMTAGRHHAWRRSAVGLLEPKVDGWALDIGCGTGDLAIALTRQGFKSVVGLDLSGPMVNIGRKKISALGLENQIQLTLGDALNLPFPDAQFTSVATAFTLRNVADLGAALKEIRRVTCPGGKMVSIEITPGGTGILSILFQKGFKLIVPVLGTVIANDSAAYSYLPDSVGRFHTAQEMTALLENVGFRNVRNYKRAFGSLTIHLAEV